MGNAVKNALKSINPATEPFFSRSPIRLVWCTLALLAFSFTSCKKYTDPEGPDLSDELTNPYCNDPRAVNYNHGFPGRPDSSVCIYPVDSFLGRWIWDDSVFTTDLDFVSTEQYQIELVATEDTAMTHLILHGWCDHPVYLTADKYRRAVVDTLIEAGIGQLGCLVTDTLSGYLNKNTGAAETMQFQFSVTDATGTLLHAGTATKTD